MMRINLTTCDLNLARDRGRYFDVMLINVVVMFVCSDLMSDVSKKDLEVRMLSVEAELMISRCRDDVSLDINQKLKLLNTRFVKF